MAGQLLEYVGDIVNSRNVIDFVSEKIFQRKDTELYGTNIEVFFQNKC